MKKLQNLSLKFKIQLIIFICVICIASVSLFSTYFVSGANQKVLYQTLSASLNYSATELSEQLKNSESLCDLIFSNSTIQKQLSIYQDSNSNSEKSACRSVIYNLLYDYIYNFQNSSINYITFYQDNEIVSTTNNVAAKLPDNIVAAFTKQAKDASGSTIWVTDYCDAEGLFIIKDVRQIERLTLKSLGIMVINIDIEQLINSTAVFQTDYEEISYLLTDHHTTLFESTNLVSYSTDSIKLQLKDEYSVISLGDKNFFAVHGLVPNLNWNYICAVSYDSIVKTINVAQNISVLVLFVCIILILISSTNMISSLTKHFDFLIDKMRCFGSGNYKPTVSDYNYSERKDEIGTLHTNFDAMTEKVDTLIQENYVNELHKKEAQIKALESQIDPHFLYNTLDAINWRAKAIGATDISQITMSMGNLLRISLKTMDENYTLQMELQALDNYITIQKLRHQNRLEYDFNIPAPLLNCEIPKLTLQPLIENAIRYGLEEMSETCFITILAKTQDSCLIIEVKNNGSVFPNDLLKKLEANTIQPNGFGIGLLNITRRIQMTYGPEYGLDLQNFIDEDEDEEYAIIRIILPIIHLT